MGQRLPDKAANLLAVAELLKNPDKVQEVAEQIRKEVSALDAAAERNKVNLDELNKFQADKDALERGKLELAEMLKVQRQNEEKVADMVHDVAEREKAVSAEKARLAAAEEELNQKRIQLEEINDDLVKREAAISSKEEELNNALKAATAEHDMWKQRNAKLQAAVA